MIPNAALAAMLIAVGIKLAHPKEFIHTFHIGKEQLEIFLVTIIVTLAEDLLIGIAAGMLLKIIIHLFNGASVKSLFKVPVEISFNDDQYLVVIEKSALFTNYLAIKSRLDSIPCGFNVTIDLERTKLTDHTVLENLEHFKHDYESSAGKVEIIGLDHHKPLSDHHLSARKLKQH